MGISTVSAAADDTASTESIVVSKQKALPTLHMERFVVLSMMELIPSVEFLMQKLTDLKCQRLLIPGMTSAIALSMVQPLLLQKMTDPDGGDFLIPHRYWAQSENCQNLNIWTQDLDSNAKKPVMGMVPRWWIHQWFFY